MSMINRAQSIRRPTNVLQRSSSQTPIPTSIGAFYGTDEAAYYQEMNTSICHNTKYTGALNKTYKSVTYENLIIGLCGM